MIPITWTGPATASRPATAEPRAQVLLPDCGWAGIKRDAGEIPGGDDAPARRPGSRVRSLELLGREKAMFKDVIQEDEIRKLSDEELLEALLDHLAASPDLMAAVRERFDLVESDALRERVSDC